MKYITILIILISDLNLWAEDFLLDIEKINTAIANEQIDEHIKSGSNEPIPGAYLNSLLPKVEIDPTQTCAEEELPKNTRYEIVLMAELNNQPKSSITMPLPKKGKMLFGEKLVEFAAKSNLSEDKLADAMAQKIMKAYRSDEDRYNALSAFAYVLYKNYNSSRNPGQNNQLNNPYHIPLPSGDLTLNEMATAAYNKNEYSGGVCNDISEAVALIGEKMFPEKDVLIINSGSHFGVVISDGKNNRIINGPLQTKLEEDLTLDPEFTATNIRISKMDNGQARQIAVVDSETGVMMEKVFQTGRPLLKTTTDLNTVVSHFGYSKQNASNQQNFSLGMGVGDLSNSKMYVVVAKYEYSSESWRNYAGVGGSLMDFDTKNELRYQLHLRTGTEFKIIKYASPHLKLNLSSGLELEGMYGIKPPSSQSFYVDASIGLDVVTRMKTEYKSNSNLKIGGSVEVRHTPGFTSLGNATGAFSEGTSSGISGTLENMYLHLNQIYATTSVEKPLGDGVSLVSGSSYQGSNIGQALTATAGLNIEARGGVQILVFTGYGTTKLPGYETKNSLLVGSNGAILGAGVLTPSGIAFTGSVRDISPSSVPFVNLGLSVDLGPTSEEIKRDEKD